MTDFAKLEIVFESNTNIEIFFRIFLGVLVGLFIASLFLPSCLFFPSKDFLDISFPHE